MAFYKKAHFIHQVDIPQAVAEVIRHFSPDLKRGVRSALQVLSVDPQQGVPLARELEGMWRYRVRRYRIVYEIDAKTRVLRIVAVDHRRHIYEELAARHRAPSGSLRP